MEEEYLKEEDFKGERGEKKNSIFKKFLESRWWTVSVVVLVAVIAFSWGKYSSIKSSREPVQIIYPSTSSGQVATTSNQTNSQKTTSNTQQAAAVVQSGASPSNSSGQVVGSKNSTKYHYPWCAGAKQISAQNLITWNSIEEARSAGYTPAVNCKGLK